MANDLYSKLKYYVEKFNASDDECYKNEITNKDALEWMREHIPLIECPDPVIEETYYFRWWTFRKHIKNTSDGYIISEFLPDVPWSGKHNSINAAAGHHLAEGKWINNREKYLNNYICFWINGIGDAFSYSTWLITAICDYCRHIGDYALALNNLDMLIKYYETLEKEHLSPCGLFWSVDDRDAMEYSISGTDLSRVYKGFRPTLNSYMAADAASLCKLLCMAGRNEEAEVFKQKSKNIREKMLKYLWKDDFYKACHFEDADGNPTPGPVPCNRDVRELIGYIPWCFDLVPEGKETAFEYLLKNDGFYTPYGLTTAEQSHPRYLYEASHECLWNGYIWPFATTQTLNAVCSVLKNKNQNVIDKNDFYKLLYDYAKSQRIKTNDSYLPWIDEVIDPRDGSWYSRDYLKALGWKKELGGYERGKDYNHSTFCDIILGGLFGISPDDNGGIKAEPLTPDDWSCFSVKNVQVCGKTYDITYDKSKSDKPIISVCLMGGN